MLPTPPGGVAREEVLSTCTTSAKNRGVCVCACVCACVCTRASPGETIPEQLFGSPGVLRSRGAHTEAAAETPSGQPAFLPAEARAAP